MKVVKGSKITKKAAPYYVELSNAYANLEKFSDDLGPTNTIDNLITKTGVAKQSNNFKIREEARRKTRKEKYIEELNDDVIIDWYIAKVEDERTSIEKRKQQRKRHSEKTSVKPSILERERGINQTVATATRRLFQQIKKGSTKRVKFAMQPLVQILDAGEEPVMITYDSGADGNYVSEEDRARLGMPILRQSKRRVGV